MQEMETLKSRNLVITGVKEKEASKHAEHIHDLIEKQTKELQDLGKLDFFFYGKFIIIKFHLVGKDTFCKFGFLFFFSYNFAFILCKYKCIKLFLL
jgi:hypothetical protein